MLFFGCVIGITSTINMMIGEIIVVGNPAKEEK